MSEVNSAGRAVIYSVFGQDELPAPVGVELALSAEIERERLIDVVRRRHGARRRRRPAGARLRAVA